MDGSYAVADLLTNYYDSLVQRLYRFVKFCYTDEKKNWSDKMERDYLFVSSEIQKLERSGMISDEHIKKKMSELDKSVEKLEVA